MLINKGRGAVYAKVNTPRNVAQADKGFSKLHSLNFQRHKPYYKIILLQSVEIQKVFLYKILSFQFLNTKFKVFLRTFHGTCIINGS